MSAQDHAALDNALCYCGHPRSVHKRMDAQWTAMCTHVDLCAVDHELDPYEGLCLCMEFVAEDAL